MATGRDQDQCADAGYGARLEFDVVVVMEPAGFAKKRGVTGQLYTSLTRANRELGVVHSKALPRGLETGKKLIASKGKASPR